MLAVVMPAGAVDVEEVYFEVSDSANLSKVIGWANSEENQNRSKHFTIAIVGDHPISPNHIMIENPLEITGHVTLTPSLKAKDGKDMTKPIHLECKISDDESSYLNQYLFTIREGGSLTICSNNTIPKIPININIDGNNQRTKSLVYVNGGTFTLDGVGLWGNTAEKGGAVYVDGGSFYMKGGVINGNTATEGGGVYINSGFFGMTDGNIKGNKAEKGGGVYVNGGSFSLSNGFIELNNEGIENGGGVYVNGGSFELIGGDIKNNKAANGGGVYITGGEVKLTISIERPNANPANIHSNTATENGGGVYLNGGGFTLEKGVIRDNIATKYGGGIYIDSNTEPVMTGGTIGGGNKAEKGGGVYINKGTFKMTTLGEGESTTSGTIQGNTAKTGSAVYAAKDATFAMYAGDITGNTAGEGFAVFIEDGEFYIVNGRITGNKAALHGGVYINGVLELSREGHGEVTISGNDGGNVFLYGESKIIIPRAIGTKTSIGVFHEGQNPDEQVLFAEGKGYYTPDFMDASDFFSDDPDYKTTARDGRLYIVYDPPEPESKGSSVWLMPVGGSYALYTNAITGGGTVYFPEGSPVQSVTVPQEFTGEIQVSTQKDQNIPQPTTGIVYKQFDVSTTAPIPVGTTAKIGISIPASDIPAGQGVSALHYQGADRGWVKEPATAILNGNTVQLEVTVSGLSPFAIVFEEGGIIPTENTDLAPPLDHEPITATPAESPAPMYGLILGLIAAVMGSGVRRR